ncbi:hypothetical protein [Hafnia sp. HMSC23F03]|uniref:hypothetical protein n=1 Tax=Hafnia sp. HMSC23F03 TaxID=1581059 RepID=UPI0009F1E90D|nr:hypothetical protein [Hafnia sp. HMSC23F03]
MNIFITLFTEYRVLSISSGVLSALYWLYSAFVTSKEKPNKAVLTMKEPYDIVDLHNFVLTARLQSKYNSRAACYAAACALLQVAGF